MASTPQIRKYILKALDERIIPTLTERRVLHLFAGPPFNFFDVEHWTLRERPIVHKNPSPLKIEWYWNKDGLVACHMPYLGIVYDGIADERVGITNRMAQNLEKDEPLVPSGVTALRLPSPCVISFPPTIPHRRGGEVFCEKSRPGFGSSRILWMHVVNEGLLLHYCESEVTHIISSHSLHLKDKILAHLAHAYLDEVQYYAMENNSGPQNLMLTLAQRLRRYLYDEDLQIGNSAWPESYTVGTHLESSVSHSLYLRAKKYIEMHLHESLNWESLAHEMDVSPFYLNRVFRKHSGQSIMRYASFCRIEAAKQMLLMTPESISDIARLTGFGGLASFSGCFKKYVGCSPSEFRRRTTED